MSYNKPSRDFQNRDLRYSNNNKRSYPRYQQQQSGDNFRGSDYRMTIPSSSDYRPDFRNSSSHPSSGNNSPSSPAIRSPSSPAISDKTKQNSSASHIATIDEIRQFLMKKWIEFDNEYRMQLHLQRSPSVTSNSSSQARSSPLSLPQQMAALSTTEPPTSPLMAGAVSVQQQQQQQQPVHNTGTRSRPSSLSSLPVPHLSESDNCSSELSGSVSVTYPMQSPSQLSLNHSQQVPPLMNTDFFTAPCSTSSVGKSTLLHHHPSQPHSIACPPAPPSTKSSSSTNHRHLGASRGGRLSSDASNWRTHQRSNRPGRGFVKPGPPQKPGGTGPNHRRPPIVATPNPAAKSTSVVV